MNIEILCLALILAAPLAIPAMWLVVGWLAYFGIWTNIWTDLQHIETYMLRVVIHDIGMRPTKWKPLPCTHKAS